ncbi:MAG: glycosyltransferase family 4 protein [Vicinamibacterales bacterium]
MKILFVANSYHPSVGGIQTQLRLVAHDLATRHHVEVAAVNFRSAEQRRRPSGPASRLVGPRSVHAFQSNLLLRHHPSYQDGRVPVHAITASTNGRLRLLPFAWQKIRPTRRTDSWWRRAGFEAFLSAVVPQLRLLMRGTDIVHALASGRLGWAAEAAARAEGVPFLITPYLHVDQKRNPVSQIELCQRADVVFALLESDARMLAELGVSEEKIRLLGVVPLLPPTCDPQAFRSRHGLVGKPIVLFVGRVTEAKGVRAMLDAAPAVWAHLPDVHFLFAGPAGETERAWFANRPDDRVRYLGLISEQEKADALAACDLFAMPSKYEILPAVYLEAWTYGKAVVGGTAHGLKALIEGHSAGIVIEQDPAAIGEQIVELLRDEPRRRRMGERGRDLVKARFSRESVTRALEAAYLPLIEAGEAGLRSAEGGA